MYSNYTDELRAPPRAGGGGPSGVAADEVAKRVKDPLLKTVDWAKNRPPKEKAMLAGGAAVLVSAWRGGVGIGGVGAGAGVAGAGARGFQWPRKKYGGPSFSPRARRLSPRARPVPCGRIANHPKPARQEGGRARALVPRAEWGRVAPWPVAHTHAERGGETAASRSPAPAGHHRRGLSTRPVTE